MGFDFTSITANYCSESSSLWKNGSGFINFFSVFSKIINLNHQRIQQPQFESVIGFFCNLPSHVGVRVAIDIIAIIIIPIVFSPSISTSSVIEIHIRKIKKSITGCGNIVISNEPISILKFKQ